jgi:hypothetical protein
LVSVQKYLNPLIFYSKILFKIQKVLFCRLPDFGPFSVGSLVQPLINFHLFFHLPGLQAHQPTLAFWPSSGPPGGFLFPQDAQVAAASHATDGHPPALGWS